MRLSALCACVMWFGLVDSASAQVTARIGPETAFVEPVRAGQALNFDVIVTNQSQTPVELSSIEVTYLDAGGAVLFQRDADGNGSTDPGRSRSQLSRRIRCRCRPEDGRQGQRRRHPRLGRRRL